MRLIVLFLAAGLLGSLPNPSAVAASPPAQSRPRPPLLLFPTCPCYHLVGEGSGDTRLDALINLPTAQQAGATLTVIMTDGSRKQIQTGIVDASRTNLVGLNLRVPIQTSGLFEIVAHLKDGSGREIATATTDVHVVTSEASRVQTGPDGFLRIAGKPLFPVGMYSAGHYEEMGKAGFNATHNYGITIGEAQETINFTDTHLKELLDNSWRNGMRMMVELPRKAIEKAQWQQVRRRIETFRHHPGLLCWGSEERVARGLAPLSNIAQLYRLVHELDPDHPLVLGDTKDVIKKLQQDRRDFFPDACMDAGIWWWYPIPLKQPDANGLEGGQTVSGILEPPSWLTTTISKKPLWIAIQSYQKPKEDSRFPTPAEYRCMAYLSIINGVKGLWFYTGSGQRDFNKKPSGLLNKTEEGHWEYVQKLVHELRELTPIITAPKASDPLTLSPSNAPVEFTLRALDGKSYLLAANKSEHPQSVRLSGPILKGRRPSVLYETHAASIEGASLADDFAPFGVHVYKLE